ncbi:hypothetical protein V8E54_001744 [Elaphomyces granulatus]
MEETSPDSQQPDKPTPSASLQEEQTSTGETDEAFDKYSLPVCKECETLFTRPESAEFRERLARLKPTRGVLQRERAEMLEEEDRRRSILEDRFMTLEEWARRYEKRKHLPRAPLPPPEPEIELRFSRSRMHMAQAAFNSYTLCQVLLSLSKKEGHLLLEVLEPSRHEAEDLGEDELHRRASHFVNAALEEAEASASVASSILLFRIHT